MPRVHTLISNPYTVTFPELALTRGQTRADRTAKPSFPSNHHWSSSSLADPFLTRAPKTPLSKKKENQKPKEEKERDIYYTNPRRPIYDSQASGWWAKHGAPEHSERCPKRTVPSPRRCGSNASRSLAPRFSAHPRRLAGTPQFTICLSDSAISAGIGRLWIRFVRTTLCLINLCEIREVFVMNFGAVLLFHWSSWIREVHRRILNLFLKIDSCAFRMRLI